MNEKMKYRRFFLIFKAEDTGFGEGGQPSGYVRIETRDGKGRFSLSAQNLREIPGKLIYKAYLIRNDGKEVCPAYIGVLQLKKGRVEMDWDFDPDDVSRTGVSIDEFNIAAVIAEYSDRINTEIICPLAAYKSGKNEWRRSAWDAIYRKDMKPGKEKASGTEYVIRGVPENRAGKPEMEETAGNTESRMPEPEASGDAAIQVEAVGDTAAQPEAGSETEEFARALGNDGVGDDDRIDFNKFMSHSAEELLKGSYEPKTQAACSDPQNCSAQYKPGMSPCAACPAAAIRAAGINKPELAGAQVQGMAGVQRPEAGSRQVQQEAEMKRGYILENLRIYLDRFFVVTDPFGSKRRDFVWWKVNNPVSLNNILFQFGIKTPMLFNPAVMMAHFKYRHLIFGIYTNKVQQKEYLVCGVPGVYNMDERPFGQMCRWVQLEGVRPRTGAFGYWLVYMDPESGKLLSFN